MPETNICKYYPHWFRRILDFQYLCRSEGEELRLMAEAMDRIHQNLFVQTMDEGTTAQWEAILRILPSPGEDLDFRRLRVLNRLSLRPPFTLIFLRERLDLIFGPGKYDVEVDYPNFTLYIEADVGDPLRYGEVSALLGIVKPCHIVYVPRPRVRKGLLLGEKAARVRMTYNYIQGRWALGQKPFVTVEELEVLKMPDTPSIRPELLHQTAELVAGDIAAARVNGTLLITALSRSTTGNVGSVTYTVARDQAAEVELAELLDKDGNVLTSSAVHVPLLEERTSIRHSFTVKEGT